LTDNVVFTAFSVSWKRPVVLRSSSRRGAEPLSYSMCFEKPWVCIAGNWLEIAFEERF